MNANVDISQVVLETKRLIIRPFKESDLDDFYEYAHVDGVGQKADWLPHQSKQESKEILDLFIKEKKTFAIVYKENNKMIGSIGLEPLDHLDKSFDLLAGREVGYVLSKDYWGQGIMPEAVSAVIRYCFDKENYDFLSCGHFISNNQSKRVIEKLGFHFYKEIQTKTRFNTVEEGKLYVLINPNRTKK